ncbi:lantibiotic dehydratase [Actinoplanes sp. LDG1-06]|uniref:Lantibiotic dehydratase n=1 Tax=Paractinoplanes ovalisporus TaxID=2810368 RepID=A0ABS2AUK7_9ACTN|nr:lantibiotic dehydratase [Actinoplanes ovalisporus]MBM2623425.1 lantibiotic dehydratase [Actinoplanes ovalisporus]
MPTVHHRYHRAGPLLIRASTLPCSLMAPSLADPADRRQGMRWLASVWALPGFRTAVELASPDLTARLDQLLTPGSNPSTKVVQRAVLAVASYLRRWQRRSTPFGLFAGVTTASAGPAVRKIGETHHAQVRADADWLAQIIDRLENHRGLRRSLFLIANNGGQIRAGRVVVPARPVAGRSTAGVLTESSVRHTKPVALALFLATQPVRFDNLVAQLAERLPRGDADKIEALLDGLVDSNILITSLRPPTTATNALTHLIGVLGSASAWRIPDLAPLVDQLGRLAGLLSAHNAQVSSGSQASLRTHLVEAMNTVVKAATPLAVDVRFDATVSVPQKVLDEAAAAASVMLRLTTQPFGTHAWLDYHARFRARYGLGGLVGVRDLVADSGLGYPAGYLGAPRPQPAWRMLTERDSRLLALVQQTALDGSAEISLSSADIDALTIGDPATVAAPPRIEIGITVLTDSADTLNQGDFDILVTGAPRAQTSMLGRFAHLLDRATVDQLAESYAPRGSEETVAAQVAFPPRRTHNDNVVRVGRLGAKIIPISELIDSDSISIDDLAVTADAAQFHLVRRSTGQRVVAYVPHALDVTVQTPPLARFLAEVGDSRSAVYGPLDLGAAARTMPYIPRIRYQRTILAPARWLLTIADLGSAAETARWRRRWRLPGQVIVCHGDQRLPLDLDDPLDEALLKSHLRRSGRLELREDLAAARPGWLGRPAELVIPMSLASPAPRPLPTMTRPARAERPGTSAVVNARLIGSPGRFDDILADHLPAFAENLTDSGVTRWWASRHRDLIRLDADQYLRLTLRLDNAAAYGLVVAQLSAWTERLHDAGLPNELMLTTRHPHPARYGGSSVMAAAEQVFATDTAAAISQLRTSREGSIPSQALAAASIARMAAGFAADPTAGYQSLLASLRSHTAAADRALTQQTRRLTSVQQIRDLTGGEALLEAWRVRHAALQAYYRAVDNARDSATILRTLVHDHHVRAVGVDPGFERSTNHLARAAAMRLLKGGAEQ